MKNNLDLKTMSLSPINEDELISIEGGGMIAKAFFYIAYGTGFLLYKAGEALSAVQG